MLKLTNSFCRYLKFTCKSIYYYRIHVKSLTYLSGRRKILGNIENIENPSCANSVVHTEQQLRLLSNIKKKYRQKRIPTNLNESKKNKQMSEQLQPSLKHVSYGGQFEISNDESTSDRRNQFEDNESNSTKKESCVVPPDFRIWETVVKKNDTHDGKSFKFKLLSYNVLAQYLLESHPYLYTECSPYNLKWKVRAARLYDEITKLAPDILCLQEVQVTLLNTFYSKFEEIGYAGIFKQKTGHRQDGCAIYFKKALFELQDHFSVEFYQPDLPILNRDNIGIMVKLLPRNYPGSPVVVATTHLLYNPKRTDVRLAQIQVFLAEIDRFAFYNNERESGHLPIILTGDLNSTPDSAVIKLLERGHVSSDPFRDNSDWKKIGVTDNCQHLSVYLNRQHGRETEFSMTKINNTDYCHKPPEPESNSETWESNYYELFNSGVISHSLNLISTYDQQKLDGNYEATTFQDYWVTVDYIYFSYCSTLRLLERLRLPTMSECDILGRLPNDTYGSDHLALAAVFELIPCRSSL